VNAKEFYMIQNAIALSTFTPCYALWSRACVLVTSFSVHAFEVA